MIFVLQITYKNTVSRERKKWWGGGVTKERKEVDDDRTFR